MDQSSLPENEDVGVSENRATQILDDFLVLQIPSEKVLTLLKNKIQSQKVFGAPGIYHSFSNRY